MSKFYNKGELILSIKVQYGVGLGTQAIGPAWHVKYQSIIHDQKGIFYSTATPLQLIKEACSIYFGTYEGKRDCVIQYLGYYQKTPIPISIIHSLYAFPTTSPREHKCVWIFLHHIAYFDEHPNDPSKTVIFFNNGTHLVVDTPPSIIYKQIGRTLACLGRFSPHRQFTLSLNERPSKSHFYYKNGPTDSPSLLYIADSKSKY